jgi:predicted TIM-barrel fold metal-dependent hydrolase
MIIDCHNHIGFDPAHLENFSNKDLLEEMNSEGIDICVIFPFTSNPDIIEQNEMVKTAIKQHPERFIGFFSMNPNLPDMTDMMQNYVECGFSGVVTDLRFGVGHGAKRFHELVECALTLNTPVWIHSDDKDASWIRLGPLTNLLSKYGGVKFLLSSMYKEATYVASRHGNVYIDTAVFELGQDMLNSIQVLGTHRILMGSNTPYGSMQWEKNKINMIHQLSNFQKRLILGRNSETLLNVR